MLHSGKLEADTEEDDKNVYNKKIAHLTPIGETLPHDDDDDIGPRNGGNRLLEPIPQEEQKNKVSKTTKQLYKALRVLKLTALVGCWVLLTVALLLNQEREESVMHTAVNSGEVKEYELHTVKSRVSVLVTLTGPFSDTRGNNTNLLHVWLYRTVGNNYSSVFEQNSTSWIVYLQPEDKLDFSPSATVSEIISLDLDQNKDNYNISEKDYNSLIYNDSRSNDRNRTTVTLRMTTSVNVTVPLTLSYQLDPIEEAQGIIYAAALLCSLYVLIIFEVVNRTIAALLSSTLSVAVLALCGCRPSLPELVSWLDVETLLLLLSMMLLVAILAQTGLFDYLAVIAFEVTGGHTWPLITCLCLFTAVFSTFLDNVTTVLLMTPVTIRLCEVMQLNPIPVLMSMVVFSNVGGAATPVGDPPNVIIASHPSVLKENINFTTFTLHMGVGILLVGVQTYLQLRYMFRDMSKLRHSVPAHLIELRQELAVWRRAAASLSSYSRDEDVVRRALEKKVERLNTALVKREAGRASKADPKFCSTLAQLKEKYRIRDKQLLMKSVISVSFVVIVFFLHAFPQMQSLSLGWTALLGALLLLVLSETEDLEPILARVEWATLLFFAALFVLMEALSKLGLISWIGNMTESIILQVNEEYQLAVAIMLILWVSGIASAFVDNIPLTTMMVRVTARLAEPAGLGLPLAPLAWALSFGACLGGNGTLIGASANVVCAGVAEQHGYRFTFLEYLKIGFPIMIGNLLVTSVYLLLCHCVFTWH
ncbi:P protein-like isoform X2 [Pectinophora gossypiella]|uniref:P protein-like isoform X2 n=1 Tax=Pectinophora gossypiella TaxID=13191 RepID=UPI00214E9F0A|nr:P protein-like isoform X2 [Pectinophora gossypiella]